jgi:hypothetical protein
LPVAKRLEPRRLCALVHRFINSVTYLFTQDLVLSEQLFQFAA